MELTLAAIRTVLKLIVMLLIGYIGGKTKILDKDKINSLSVILKEIMMTCMLLSIGFRAYNASMVKGILWCFIWSFISQFAGNIIAIFTIKKKGNPDWQVERGVCCAANVGFIGTAVVSTMLPPEGLVYMVGPMMSCNMLMWTFGECIIAENLNKDGIIGFLKSKLNICMLIGIGLYLLHPNIPSFISEPISTVGGMTGSTAMIVSGATLAGMDIKKLFANLNTYLIMVNRLIICPLLVIPMVLLMPSIDPLAGVTTFICCACPIPSLMAAMAVNHGKNDSYTAGLVTLSLVLSMFTIPMVVALYSAVLPTF